MRRIITLNVAGRKDIGARLGAIVQFLNEEQADIVCFQEVTFGGEGSLADIINEKLDCPYDYVRADLAEKYEREGCQLTDGLAVLSREEIKSARVVTLTKVPEDENGRPDFHRRIAQFVTLGDGEVIINTHLASNNNSHLQFEELLSIISEKCILAGDFNLPKAKMLERRELWGEKYCCSIDFTDYISFPREDQTFDYILAPKTEGIMNIRAVSGLSDHDAVLCDMINYPDGATEAERAVVRRKIAEISDADFGYTDLREKNDEIRFCVRAVVENPKGDICVVKSERLGYMQLPGGGIEEGETIEEALRREVQEEAGWTISDIEPLGYIIERRESMQHKSSYNTAVSFAYRVMVEKEVGTNYTAGEIEDEFAPTWMRLDDFIAEQEEHIGKIESYSGNFSNMRDLKIAKNYKEVK